MPNPKPWLRFIEAGTPNLAPAPTPTPPSTPEATHTEKAPAPGAPAADGDEGAPDEDPQARGSKQAVLADLARERDKRQELEAQRDALQKQVDEHARSKMTDQEKIQADLEAERKRAEEFKAQLEAEQRKGWARDALAKTGLPAEMADRLRGDTAEDIMADAEALKKTLGFDRAPVDPTQGKTADAKPKFSDLGSAIAAHYEANK